MTMIEKVARALDPSLWRVIDDGMSMPAARQMSLDAARRAIEAMREPGDDMVMRGMDHIFHPDHVTDCYRSMIDAATRGG